MPCEGPWETQTSMGQDRYPGDGALVTMWRRTQKVAAAITAVALLFGTAACSSTATGHKPSISSAGALAITAARRPSPTVLRDCVTDEPATWMNCLVKADPDFGRFALSALSLPGSRNGGAYNLDPESFDTQAGSACTSFTAHDANLGPEFARWSQTQDETITEQLDQGVRFIDLAVAYNGNGSALSGWRVVDSLYSDYPLYDYLDQVATFAKAHPGEVVIVDLSRVCYDNGAKGALADGLWANFATRSDIESSHATLAQVAFDPEALSGSLANATIDELAKPGHNVVVLVPDNVVDLKLLTTRYKVHPIVVEATAGNGSSTDLEVEYADAQVAPVSTSAVSGANSELESNPLKGSPALGALVGKGLFVTQLAYSVTNSSRTRLFKRFGGLITSLSETNPIKILPAWEATLWDASAPRNKILAAWGHRTNIVLADGVEYGGFIQAVIGLNAR